MGLENFRSLYVSKGFVEKDGVPLLTSTAIDLKQNTNSDDVDTILDDAAGYAQGTTKYMVDIASPIPADGFEIDWFKVCEVGQIHNLRFVWLNPDGGVAKEITLRGVFRDPSSGIKANTAATAGVQFHGRRLRPAV